jgi:hypothetical protein
VRELGAQARQVAVTFNNNNRDYPIQNALDVKHLLGLEAPDYPGAATPDGAEEGESDG